MQPVGAGRFNGLLAVGLLGLLHRRCQRRLGAGATDTYSHRFVRLSGVGRGLSLCLSQTPSQNPRWRCHRPQSLGPGSWALQAPYSLALFVLPFPNVGARQVSLLADKEKGQPLVQSDWPLDASARYLTQS